MTIRARTRWVDNLGMEQWFAILLAGIIGLAVANIFNDLIGRPFWPVTRWINLGMEGNIPTWYSSLLLMVAAVFAFMCYQSLVRDKRESAFAWLVLPFFLTALSCDETARIHEQVGKLLVSRVAPELAEHWKHSAWPLILGPFAILFVILLALNLRKHLLGNRQAATLLLSGTALFFASAILIESTINYLSHDRTQWLWDIEIIVEETGEMVGAWLAGLGLFRHWRFLKSPGRIRAFNVTMALLLVLSLYPILAEKLGGV